MSISVTDILSIINTIKASVETYHSNNAICKELARLSCRLGSFLEANLHSIEFKIQSICVNNSLKNVKDILENVNEEIGKYEAKGMIKHLLKARKYNDRFKELCLDIHNSQISLQTTLLSYVSQKVSDISEDVTFICETVCDISEAVVSENCDAVIDQFSNEFMIMVTEKFDKLEGLLELNNDDQKQLLISILEKQEKVSNKVETDDLQRQLSQIIQALDEIKNMTPIIKKNYGTEMIKNSIKLKPEECIPSSDFEVDWNDSLGQGSFGSVFRGKYKSHDIAVKVLNVFDRTQFLDEISVLRKVIGNKHIINYYGWSIVRPPMVFNEFCCIISNYCPLNLRSVIQNKDNYKEEKIFYRFMKYLKQIANALNHLARNGVIHRDSDDCEIADFGLAVTKSSYLSLSSSTSKVNGVGTTGYKAPEVLIGKSELASDIYSYGVLSCHLIIGKYPWFDDRGTPLLEDTISNLICKGELAMGFTLLTIDNFPIIKDKVLNMMRACCHYDPFMRPRFTEVEDILNNPLNGDDVVSDTITTSSVSIPSKLPTVEKPPPKPPRLEKLKKLEFENKLLKEELEKLKIEENNNNSSIQNQSEKDSTSATTTNNPAPADNDNNDVKESSTWINSVGYSVRILSQHTASVVSVCISYDNTILVSGSKDMTIKIWNLATSLCLKTITCHSTLICVGLSFDSSFIVAGCENTNAAKLYDTGTGAFLYELNNPGHTSEVRALACSKIDNRIIVTGSKDRTLKVWASSSHIKQGSVCLQTLKGHTGSVDNTINLWRKSDDTNGIKTINQWVLLRTLSGHTGDIHSVCISDDSKLIASGAGDRQIKIWKSVTGELVNTLSGHNHWIYTVKFAHALNETILISGSRDDSMILWNLKEKNHRQIHCHNNSVTSIAISHDNKFVVTGSADRTIKIWESQGILN